MMTRKDYVAIAKVISHTPSYIVADELSWLIGEMRAAIAHGLADHMEQDNPNFNRGKFIEACSEVEVQAVPSDVANLIHTLHGGDTNGN